MSSVRPPSSPPEGWRSPAPSGRHLAAAACMLLVGDRVVLRAAAPPEAEYALFELADIELRASEPGRVREHGYQTTVKRARARLLQHGVSAALARACATSMVPVISEAYARGAAVRRVARYLSPLELLQSDTCDASGVVYGGVYLDLAQLGRDLGDVHVALHALYLAVLLEGEDDDTTIFLATDGWTKTRKPGERTFRRPALGALKDVVTALTDLSARAPAPQTTEALPRSEVIAFVRNRADSATDEDTRALYTSLERTLNQRDMPERGPLADPELWAIEARIDAGEVDGLLDEVERIERTRGRTPGTTYLRARTSLALGLEAPKLVAERISALALSMTSFQELSLLAAEAWLDAAEPRRAVPYARDLVDAPSTDEGLLLRAQRVLARAVGAAPDKHATLADSISAAPMPASVPAPAQRPSQAPVSAPDPSDPRTYEPGRSRIPTVRGEATPSETPPPAEAQAEEVVPPLPARGGTTNPGIGAVGSPAPLPIPNPPPRRPAMAEIDLGMPPPPLDLDLPPAESAARYEAISRPEPAHVSASFTLDLPGPAPAPRPERISAPPQRRLSGPVAIESRTPSMVPDPRAEPESERTPMRPLITERPQRRETSGRITGPPRDAPRAEARPARTSAPPREEELRPTPLRPPSQTPFRPPAPTPMLDAGLPPEVEAESRRPSSQRVYMHGASQPPFRLENPAPLVSRAPLFPKVGAHDELVEHLALPPGVSTDVRLDELPRSILEARVQFTLLARELGLDYRLKRGIELRADVTGIEAMQAVLLESFPDHEVRTVEEAYELKRHGALLGEILSRRLEGEWIDISPNELGYWSMLVLPDTRVWPFGRVARLVQMGHRERDLVSYFFELQSRARGR